jgi:hypothetical protein
MHRDRRHAWSHRSTEYTLLKREHGDRWHAPTGEVKCDGCGRVARDVEAIDHADGCPNAVNPWPGGRDA